MAKNVLSVHGVDTLGKTVLRNSLSRSKLLLAEFGITLRRSSQRLHKALPGLTSDERVPLPVRALDRDRQQARPHPVGDAGAR